MSFHKMDTKKIEQAITKFEERVDFELVPVITQKSSYTEHIAPLISLILLIFFIALIEFFFHDSWTSRTGYYIAAPFLAVVLGTILDRLDWVDRFFISKKERTRQVQQKAERVFFLKHLNELKHHNSLILLISVMERKIVILPDPLLKMPELPRLQAHLLSLLSSEFKKSQFEEGFLKAIAYLETELAPHFPKNKQNSVNEVPNKLIWLED